MGASEVLNVPYFQSPNLAGMKACADVTVRQDVNKHRSHRTCDCPEDQMVVLAPALEAERVNILDYLDDDLPFPP